jgi:hypothetical protein
MAALEAMLRRSRITNCGCMLINRRDLKKIRGRQPSRNILGEN